MPLYTTEPSTISPVRSFRFTKADLALQGTWRSDFRLHRIIW